MSATAVPRASSQKRWSRPAGYIVGKDRFDAMMMDGADAAHDLFAIGVNRAKSTPPASLR
eukprot:10438281-Lingulodinium_polyedra.AAC.1